MKKLERVLFILGLCTAVVAFTGAALEKRAIIYEKERTVERGILYGGATASGISIIFASCLYDGNNRKKKNSNRNYKN